MRPLGWNHPTVLDQVSLICGWYPALYLHPRLPEWCERHPVSAGCGDFGCFGISNWWVFPPLALNFQMFPVELGRGSSRRRLKNWKNSKRENENENVHLNIWIGYGDILFWNGYVCIYIFPRLLQFPAALELRSWNRWLEQHNGHLKEHLLYKKGLIGLKTKHIFWKINKTFDQLWIFARI